MSTASEKRPRLPQTVAEAAVRTLRHEVGDLLQTVYAAAAILQQKLPADWDLERRILSDLRARGEGCRMLLDLSHDLICPLTLYCEEVDLVELLAPQVASVAGRYPALAVDEEVEPVPSIFADPVRITQLARLLLADVCDAAVSRVHARLRPAMDGAGIEWTVTCDGPAPEHLAQYFGLGKPGYRGPSALARLLARRIVELHRGRLTAREAGDTGLALSVELPLTEKGESP
jgi:signal transduction histidine kinase